MGFHTFDVGRAPELEDESRYRYCSRENLLALLAPHEGMIVADLGSGTGFYTDDVAPYVGTLYAIDVQEAMHEIYREKGLPENVETITASIEELPLAENGLDAAFSVDTYHEYHTEKSLSTLARVVRPGGIVITIDWSARGDRVAGPSLDERFTLGEAVRQFADAGFTIEAAVERAETYVCIARL